MNTQQLEQKKQQLEVQIAQESQEIARLQSAVQQASQEIQQRTNKVLLIQGALGGVMMALGEEIPQGLLPNEAVENTPVHSESDKPVARPKPVPAK